MPEDLAFSSPFRKRILKPLLGVLAGCAIIFGLLPLMAHIFEPTSPVENVLVSNTTDHQASISWTTQKPTKGAISVGKFKYKDDGDKSLKREGFYTTHLVTLNSLAPSKTYAYTIKQGWYKKYVGNVSTGPILPNPTNPNPVYGKILSSDKKPIVGAIILLQASNGSDKSAPISTLTNLEGRWTLDMANLRTSNLTKSFPVIKTTSEKVLVVAGIKGSGKAETLIGRDKPWPDIILTK